MSWCILLAIIVAVYNNVASGRTIVVPNYSDHAEHDCKNSHDAQSLPELRHTEDGVEDDNLQDLKISCGRIKVVSNCPVRVKKDCNNNNDVSAPEFTNNENQIEDANLRDFRSPSNRIKVGSKCPVRVENDCNNNYDYESPDFTNNENQIEDDNLQKIRNRNKFPTCSGEDADNEQQKAGNNTCSVSSCFSKLLSFPLSLVRIIVVTMLRWMKRN